MKQLKLFLTAAMLFVLCMAQAQNPWAKYGYTPPKALTLSDGKYQEFFNNDTIVQIGSVLFNTVTNQVVAFVEYDTTYSEATLKPEVISRWLSPDPMEKEFPSWTPYNYGFNNPIYWTDPDGRCPICPWLDAVVDVAFVVYDVGELIYDKATTGKTSATSWAALSADAASILVPMATGAGIGVRAAAKAGEATVKVVKAEKVATKAAETTNKSEKARFIVDAKGVAVDTKATPKGSYKQPDGSRTDVLQDKTHHNKSTGENVGQSHTHEPYSNTDPKTGKTYSGADANKAHKPTFEEVKNIETGKATPTKKKE